MSALIKGIDISRYQPKKLFNWYWIAKEFKFVIARACFGVSSDPLFESHVTNARRVGLKVGAYIFYRQTQGWEEQFKAFVAEMDRVELGAGDIYPVVDLEWPSPKDGKTKRKVYNTEGKKLCEALAAKYGKVIIYTAPGFYGTLGSPKWMSDERYIIWLTHYTLKDQPLQPASLTEWTIWQNRGNTFKNKDGSVKIPGGRATGFGNGKRDIDTNLAKEIPIIPVAIAVDDEDEMPADVGDPDHPVDDVEEEPGDREDRPVTREERMAFIARYSTIPTDELNEMSMDDLERLADELSEETPPEENEPPEEVKPEPETPESKPPESPAQKTRTSPRLSAILALLAGIIGALLSKWMW